MGIRERTEVYFRKRLKRERDTRGWSQSEMAKLLSDNGIPMHATTIAKIEAGDRAVRIEEATGMADLFEVSLDGLLGRKGMEDDASHAITVLADEARRAVPEVAAIMDRLRLAYQDLEAQYDFATFDQHIAERKPWTLEGLPIEHQRALVMWTGREMAIARLYQVMTGLYSVVAFRSMTARQLADAMQLIRDQIDQHAAEWRTLYGVRTVEEVMHQDLQRINQQAGVGDEEES